MKYFIVFLAVCVALAAAAPQLLTYPGLGLSGAYLGYNPIVNPLAATRTLVAGPTVVNGWGGSRLITPGYVGPALI